MANDNMGISTMGTSTNYCKLKFTCRNKNHISMNVRPKILNIYNKE